MTPWFVDTTLRDGEQAAGVAFGPDQALQIAERLAAIGIPELEVGIPAMGSAELLKMQSIARRLPNLRTTAWCRAKSQDVEAAKASGANTIHLSFPTSDLHLKVLNRTWDWVLEQAEALIGAALAHFAYVSIGAQDASRTDARRLVHFGRHVRDLGAARLRVADTVGVWHPLQCANLVQLLREKLPGLPIGVHTHNDLGMATANAVAAACAGAHSVDVTVNGLGERAGNAALEEVVMAFEVALGTPTGLKTEQLVGLSQFVARCCGRAIPLSKPIVGTNAFTHESGIHVHALLRNARSYEAFSPERVGHTDRLFVIGKHLGMSAIRHVLRHRQLEVTNVAEQGLLEAVRSRAERHRGHVNPEELVDLVATYTR